MLAIMYFLCDSNNALHTSVDKLEGWDMRMLRDHGIIASYLYPSPNTALGLKCT